MFDDIFLEFSDNGRFLAIGNVRGDVDVYICSSLQRCYRVAQVHQFFVSAVEFMPSTQTSLELVGNHSEAALISVSGDKQIVMHKIPKRGMVLDIDLVQSRLLTIYILLLFPETLSFFGSFLFFVFFTFCIYLMVNYLDYDLVE